ncbi:MAG: hypothetical protein ACMUJM_14670 [bacterium]
MENIIEAINIQIAQLVDMNNAYEVFDEVKTIVFMISPEFAIDSVNVTFQDVVDLFEGRYPGYNQCNTMYHDLVHTMSAMLAMTRLIHGAILQGETISNKNIALGLISALMHDTGYIQDLDDMVGTGAKYTLTHIKRSIEFMEKYFKEKGFSGEDFENCRDILECTGLNTKIHKIKFKSRQIELLGKMLGTADLLGQMADRLYLEKLIYLYYEFKEGGIEGYDNEFNLLTSTFGFFSITERRMAGELGGVNKYMIHHLRKRWNIDKDLYKEAIEKNERYLKFILENHDKGYRDFLRRGGIIKKLEEAGM